MKFFVIFALTVATVSAYDLRNAELKQRNLPVMESETRIVNGFEVDDQRFFPFQVGLNLSLFDQTFGWCSGVLISETFVLTLAYCLEFTDELVIHFGSIKRSEPEKKVTVYNYSGFIIHADYNVRTLENNIGLIKFKPIAYTDTIQPATLPPDYIIGDPSFYDKSIFVPGWGVTVENGTLAEVLRVAASRIISNDECAKNMENVFDTNICMESKEDSSPCQGDEGSPMILIADKYVVGVFSFISPQGCDKGYPAVFERVTSHLAWIREHTGIESQDN